MEDENSSAVKDFIRSFEDISLQFLDASFALYHNQDKDQNHDGWWYYLQEVIFCLVVDEADLYRTHSSCSSNRCHLIYTKRHRERSLITFSATPKITQRKNLHISSKDSWRLTLRSHWNRLSQRYIRILSTPRLEVIHLDFHVYNKCIVYDKNEVLNYYRI